MRLTAFTDYSLRVLIFLAASPDGRATIGEVAAAFGISENHLTKIVHFLGKAGLLANTRGRGGGLALAAPAGAINVGKVVRLTEGPAIPAECFEESPGRCALGPVCRLREVLGKAVGAFYAVLDGYSIEDLVENRAAISRILFVNRPARDG